MEVPVGVEVPAGVDVEAVEPEVTADSEAGAAELSVVVGVWQEARPRTAKAPRRVRTFFFMFFRN